MELIFSSHAIKRMFERNISVDDVREIVLHGQEIAVYPDDQPFPSRLILSFASGRALHAVTATNDDGHAVVITVYEPDLNLWDSTFTRRLK